MGSAASRRNSQSCKIVTRGGTVGPWDGGSVTPRSGGTRARCFCFMSSLINLSLCLV